VIIRYALADFYSHLYSRQSALTALSDLVAQ